MDTETESLRTETDSLGTETDFCEYRNGLCWYRIVILGVKIDRNTKNRYKLQCQAVQIGYVEQLLLNVFGVGVSWRIL